MGWELTIRKVSYLLEASETLNNIAEHGYDPNDVSDEFIDQQFNQFKLHGMEMGNPYSIKEVRVRNVG